MAPQHTPVPVRLSRALTGSVRCRLEPVSRALEELLLAARRQDCLTLGVYESAKLMNA